MKKYAKVLKIKDIKKSEEFEGSWEITLILEGEKGIVEHRGFIYDLNEIFVLKEYISV